MGGPSFNISELTNATSDITYDVNGTDFRSLMLKRLDIDNRDGVIHFKKTEDEDTSERETAIDMFNSDCSIVSNS